MAWLAAIPAAIGAGSAIAGLVRGPSYLRPTGLDEYNRPLDTHNVLNPSTARDVQTARLIQEQEAADAVAQQFRLRSQGQLPSVAVAEARQRAIEAEAFTRASAAGAQGTNRALQQRAALLGGYGARANVEREAQVTRAREITDAETNLARQIEGQQAVAQQQIGTQQAEQLAILGEREATRRGNAGLKESGRQQIINTGAQVAGASAQLLEGYAESQDDDQKKKA